VTRLLLVSQLAPPSGLIAARRVAGLTKYLARVGFEITVLTSQVSGSGPIEGAAEIVRTRDLLATSVNWRRRSLEVMSSGVPGTYRRPSPLQSLLVPDPAAVSWLPFALPAARRLGRFDVVLTTSPPQSAHFVGAALAHRGTPWVAELRDGWTFEPPRPEWPLAPLRALDRRLERTLQGARAVVGVTRPIAADLRDRLGLNAHVITNGFDPEEQPAPGDEELLDPERHSFVHTGRVGVTGTSLDPLLEALRLLVLEDGIEVVFAGPFSDVETEQLAAPELRRVVATVGVLDRPHTLRLQRAADTLLLITEGARRTSVATGKLFEYLATGRPIVVLGEETEAARIVAETQTGFAVPLEPAAIAEGLRRAREVAVAPFGVEWYTYPAIAEQYGALLQTVAD
jgi:glycosyltransferase involved in cell wall biosynthesis